MSSSSLRYVMVCQHSSCLRQGAARVLLAFQVADLPEDVVVLDSGCQGQCSTSPTVRILPDEAWYCRLKVDDVTLIVEQHLRNGIWVREKLHPRFHPLSDTREISPDERDS